MVSTPIVPVPPVKNTVFFSFLASACTVSSSMESAKSNASLVALIARRPFAASPITKYGILFFLQAVFKFSPFFDLVPMATTA